MSSLRVLPWPTHLRDAAPLPSLGRRRVHFREAVPVVQPLGRRIRWPELIWLSFVLVQVLDGVMSYIGIQHIGWMEGNPVVEWYTIVLGPAVAFTVVKLFAVACGSVLYLKARHGIVAALTLFYLAFAVGPWAHIIGTYGLR
jgi:Domain of unknown function (DUF5658)